MRRLPFLVLFLALAACATGGAGKIDPGQVGRVTCGSAAVIVAVCDAGGGKPDVCNAARVALAFCAQQDRFAAAQSFAATALGSGYDPRTRGLTLSCFRLDNVNGPERCVAIDFSADPANARPGSAEFVELYERRWGRCTLNGCVNDNPPHFFKRWRGAGNEVKSTLADALQWACRSGLLGPVHAPDCRPTETEIIDCQATGDRIWEGYLRAEIPGFRADNRIEIADPGKPHGDGQEKHPFWGITWYYRNTATPPAPRCGDGNRDPGETCLNCPADIGACPSPPDGKADCSRVILPAPGAPQYVGYTIGTDSSGVVECRGGSLPPAPAPTGCPVPTGTKQAASALRTLCSSSPKACSLRLKRILGFTLDQVERCAGVQP